MFSKFVRVLLVAATIAVIVFAVMSRKSFSSMLHIGHSTPSAETTVVK